MSTMKNGFSTLNRWLGKKNKDKKISSNGNLSKSNTNLNLSISNNNINETSQLEYNRITPLPAATSNAPFEQTFRITVLLPKDQLYVTRLGARVPLSKLLELVCEHKLLNSDKYEFRNPVDASQVFNLKLSIGAVGLSEIRLCSKTDPYDNFNTDEVVKLRRTSGMRDSCSSSEFSSRQSKHTTTKTISPYGSSNSLNSLESSSTHYAHVHPKPISPAPKVTAPPRKKRAAPRPPSQTTIHEQETLTNGQLKQHTAIFNLQQQQPQQMPLILGKKNYYVSTPDLASMPHLSTVAVSEHNNNINNNNNSNTHNGNFDASELYARVEKKNVRNLYGGSVQNLTTVNGENFPEPSPRKRLIQLKNKKAPAPPASRSSSYMAEDSLSLCASIIESPTQENDAQETMNNEQINKTLITPQPVPRVFTTTNINNNNNNNNNNSNIDNTTTNLIENKFTSQLNVSKVLLNRTPTPEPRSLTSDVGDMDQMSDCKQQNCSEDDDAVSKQADSGIGEPVPSPLPDSLQSEGSTHECKSTFESSSDDDEMIRVYNFKLGKTVTQALDEHDLLPTTPTVASGESTPATVVPQTTPCLSETASWNFCIPISPPPNFADDRANKNISSIDKIPDSPITPKINQRPMLDFDCLTTEETKVNNMQKPLSKHDASTPLDEIVDELSAILQKKGVASLIKKAEVSQEIEAAKPNTLSNFSIVSLEPTQTAIVTSTSSTPITPEEEQQYYKRNSVTLRTRNCVTRADSFHTAADVTDNQQMNGLNSRSSSCAALAKLEETVNNMATRNKSSSSELSIAESPSLQSLEIMKTILSSRKNSFANSSSDGEKTNEISTANALKPKIDNKKAAETANDNKPIPKVYRYSGPPSINLGTWNERPKAQVSIKNEGDYIFGGKNANFQNAAMTTAVVNFTTKDKLIERQQVFVTSPTHNPIKRMGIPEQEFRVPITVKPLKDVTVQSVNVTEQKLNLSTLPRNKNQRFSMPAEAASIKRSVSITALEASKMLKKEQNQNQIEAPFGQNCLRKTGLKEKILAANDETKENTAKADIKLTENNKFSQNHTQSAAKTLANIKLNKSTSVIINQRIPTPPAVKSAPVAPPAPPIFKPLKAVKTATNNQFSTIDPRDQLLDSIRSFKREKLKRSNS